MNNPGDGILRSNQSMAHATDGLLGYVLSCLLLDFSPVDI